MKHVLLGLTLVLSVLGIIFYSNMMHLACILSLLMALTSGAAFTYSLSRQYMHQFRMQEEIRKRITADVAHELRTPLASVALNLEAFAEGSLEPTREQLSKCIDDIDRLSRLVADMERLALTESRLRSLDREPTELLDLVRVVFHRATGSSAMVNVDRDRIIEVLENLRSNAEKYGADPIEVEVHNERRHAVITVRDHGEGIAPEDLPHVFERFYRADKSRNSAQAGSGIGLAIVQEIVEAHSGDVRVESDPGKGCTFIVRLPKR